MKLSTALTTLLASSLLLSSVATAARTISNPNPLHMDNLRTGNTTSRIISTDGPQRLMGAKDFSMTDSIADKIAAMHDIRSAYHDQCDPVAAMSDTQKLQCIINLPTHLALILDYTEGVQLSEQGQAFVMRLDMRLRKTALNQHERLLVHITTMIESLRNNHSDAAIIYDIDLQELRLISHMALQHDLTDIVPLASITNNDDINNLRQEIEKIIEQVYHDDDHPTYVPTSTTTHGSQIDTSLHLSYYDVTIPTSVRAGEIFGIEVRAMDSDHTIITDYSDSTFFTINSPQSNYTVPLNGVVPFAPEHQGVRTLDHSMMIRTPGRYTLTIENLLATVSKQVTIIVTASE